MRTVRGHYDGSVVILDEPAPVDEATEVQVTFPDKPRSDGETNDRFGWEKTRRLRDGYAGSVADEVIRERQLG